MYVYSWALEHVRYVAAAVTTCLMFAITTRLTACNYEMQRQGPTIYEINILLVPPFDPKLYIWAAVAAGMTLK